VCLAVGILDTMNTQRSGHLGDNPFPHDSTSQSPIYFFVILAVSWSIHDGRKKARHEM
jgi:hypothetical protein